MVNEVDQVIASQSVVQTWRFIPVPKLRLIGNMLPNQILRNIPIMLLSFFQFGIEVGPKDRMTIAPAMLPVLDGIAVDSELLSGFALGQFCSHGSIGTRWVRHRPVRFILELYIDGSF